MAFIYIREYSEIVVRNGATMVGREPGFDQPRLAITAGSLQSQPFQPKTALVRIETDVVCSVAYGMNPIATVLAGRMAANQTEYFGVNPGDMVAVIANT